MGTNDSNQYTELKAMASVTTPDLGLDPQDCLSADPSDPCTIVIMGATGDLTARKLIPALFDLYKKGGLPQPFHIMGCGRTRLSDQAFRSKMEKALAQADLLDQGLWPTFSSALHYQSIQYDNPTSFQSLAASLKDFDTKLKTGGNRIFYVALPPMLYMPVAHMIGQAGLSTENQNGNGWSRIVIEKPFGTNLRTAQDLDKSLHLHFKEHQIYRIDHYLAKETVQNLLMFRFANSLFEPVWNRRYIDYINIRATETLGVEHRAGYYEQSGILRDMFQNHMMQLLALTAMEPPSRFEADIVRDETVKVFRALRPFPVENIEKCLTLGQYAAGTINGRSVPAYREEPGVKVDSLTPTFAMMKVFLDNWRWQGVPFFLTSGKRLDKKITEISIQFKTVPHSMFRRTLDGAIVANRLNIGIYPEEKILLTFQTKNPGAAMCLRTVTMEFEYNQNYTGPVLDAYEKVLIDCMLGDQMLFWRQDGIEKSWSFLTPVLNECDTCSDRPGLLNFYEAGSNGPAEARALSEKEVI
jgi:glucose-6-phosphate 1-dehydrogenase